MPTDKQQETETRDTPPQWNSAQELNSTKWLSEREEIFPQSSLRWDNSSANILTTAHWYPKAEDPAELRPEIWPTEN